MIKSFIALLTLCGLAYAHVHAEKQPLVYGVFNENCYAKLNQVKGLSLFLEDSDCVKFSLSKLVGYLIVLGAVIVKVP